MEDYGAPMRDFNPRWKTLLMQSGTVAALCLLIGTYSRDRSSDISRQLLEDDAAPSGTHTLKSVQVHKESAAHYVGTTQYKDGTSGTVEVSLDPLGTLGLTNAHADYAVDAPVVAQAPSPPRVIISYASPPGFANPPGAPGVNGTVAYNSYIGLIGDLRARRADLSYPAQVASLRGRILSEMALDAGQRASLLSALNDENGAAYALNPPLAGSHGDSGAY